MPKNFIRKRNRLSFKELYQGGHWYFVTVCVQERKEDWRGLGPGHH